MLSHDIPRQTIIPVLRERPHSSGPVLNRDFSCTRERHAGRMAQFLGTHQNRLDAKGRVSVPAPFRSVLKK